MSAQSSGANLPVVTMWETYGSGAEYVGPRVAEALKLPFHEQAFSSSDIESADAGEPEGSVLSRVMGFLRADDTGMSDHVKTFLQTGYTGISEPADVPVDQRDNYNLVMENSTVVHEQARHGGVIVGRNATVILADRPATLHVKLDGPLEHRVARTAEHHGIDTRRARARQRREDSLRAEMSIKLYGWDPRENDHYDLVVNTGRVDLDLCVQIIAEASRAVVAHKAAGV